MDVLDKLIQRGFIEQVTDKEGLSEILSKQSVPFYFGVDPTADSTHVGHLVVFTVAKHLQDAGHKPIILIGGATGNIGDPSGKQEMRKVLTKEEVNHNKECIKKQAQRLLSFEGDNAAILVDNSDWTSNVEYINFLRDVGIYFNVNQMLAAECYKSRLKEGLTFLELGYMLIQANDFKHLYENFGCMLELGGNDQWSNILAGVDLVRKSLGKKVYAATVTLLTTKEGKKMGKTEKGALWLDSTKTTPFEMYQYFRNIDDSEIQKVMYMLTMFEKEEIDKMMEEEKNPNVLKEIAAYDIVSRIHGKEEADKARQSAQSLYSNTNNLTDEVLDGLKEVVVKENDKLIDVAILCEFGTSKGQIKTLIAQNGITLNDKPVQLTDVITKDQFEKGFAIFKKGKKQIIKLVIE